MPAVMFLSSSSVLNIKILKIFNWKLPVEFVLVNIWTSISFRNLCFMFEEIFSIYENFLNYFLFSKKRYEIREANKIGWGGIRTEMGERCSQEMWTQPAFIYQTCSFKHHPFHSAVHQTMFKYRRYKHWKSENGLFSFIFYMCLFWKVNGDKDQRAMDEIILKD